ncbi:MAG: 5-deoxy-glucuronate isomerase, partial [Clostridium sp.]
YSNMVMGEVITYPGRWSSYPPHHHPQPEVYYYRFDKPQGFGVSIIGDDSFVVKDNSAALIPGGLVHPQTSAPGYAMYYCWMIRHFDNNPWTARIDDEAHIWIIDKDAEIWEGK